METYESPINFLNAVNTGHGKERKCDFKPKLPEISKNSEYKQDDQKKVKAILPQLKGVGSKKVHEKGNFKTMYYQSRLPEFREMMKEIDENIIKELGKPKEKDSSGQAEKAGDTETILSYVQQKRTGFHSNFLMKYLKTKIETMKEEITKKNKDLDDREEELYKDACAFRDLLKDSSARYLVEANKLYEETELHNTAKVEYQRCKREQALLVETLTVNDEKLQFLLRIKNFLLLAQYNFDHKTKKPTTEITQGVKLPAISAAPLKASETNTSVSTNRSRAAIKAPSAMKSLTNSKSKLQSKAVLKFTDDSLSLPTKLKYPEEWLDNTAVSDAKTKKLTSILGNPQWLLKILKEFEEECLLFIKKFQSSATREELIKEKLVQAKNKLIPELHNLEMHCDLIKRDIDMYESKTAEYEFKAQCVGSLSAGDLTESELRKITKRIEKVYHSAEKDAVKTDVLNMMMKIEGICYIHFDTMETMGANINKAMKKVEVMRRLKNAADKEEMDNQKRLEMMLKKGLESGGTIFRGRRMNPRSQPAVPKNQSKRVRKGEEEDLSYYFE